MNSELYNLDAELSVLSSLLIDNNLIYDLNLNTEDFYSISNSKIFKTIYELLDKNSKVDLLTLSNELENKKILSEVGGNIYLANITNHLSNSNTKEHSEIIKNLSIRRKLIKAQQINEQEIYNNEIETETVLANTQSRIFEVSKNKKQDDGIKVAINELYEQRADYSLKYEQGKKFIGIETGLAKLDNIIDGLRECHLWVVGGWTSTGKSQFALNIVNSVCSQGIPVSFYSLEMGRVDLTARLVGIRTNLSSMKVIKGKCEPELLNLIEGEIDAISKFPLEIHTAYFEIEKIKMMIRKDYYTRGVKLVIVDYLQNIQSSRYTKEYDVVSKAISELYALAQELKITIYVVSQISNESEKGTGAGAGFKGSGSIEAAADLAIRLKRDKDKEKEDDVCVPVKLQITKNRHGFVGRIDEYFMYLKSGLFSANPTLQEGIKVFSKK